MLLIDDDDMLRGIMQRLAPKISHFAATGRQGIEAASTADGAILVDIGLPDINGFEVTRQLRCSQPSTFVAVFTSSADPRDLAAAQAAGADAFLTKGMHVELLIAAIDEIDDAASRKKAHRPYPAYEFLTVFDP